MEEKEEGKDQGSDTAEVARTQVRLSSWPIYLALICFCIAFGIHGGGYFIFGFQGIFVIFAALLFFICFLLVTTGLIFDAVRSAFRARDSAQVRLRLGIFICMGLFGIGYWMLEVPFYLMHYGILKRVESEVDIAKLQAWSEEQTRTLTFGVDDSKKLKLPIQQPSGLETFRVYGARWDGVMDDGRQCLSVWKDFGGGFWDFGVLIGPRGMTIPNLEYRQERYHQWRHGVYTWL